jgi:phenylacetate-coenzyme A ligase PaaK-like adenylate-forming protein
MIRYDTGDIAELAESPCVCGEVGTSVKIVGRRVHCIDLSHILGKAWFLGTTDLETIVGDMPFVPFLPYPRFRWTLSGRDDGGSDIRIDIEVQSRSALDPSAFASELARRIVSLSADLRDVHGEGRLGVCVTPYDKGDLESHFQLLRDR